MKYFKKLVGDRIYLSPRNPEDVEKYTEWLNDFYITDYIGRSGAMVTLDGEKKYLIDSLDKEANFAIVTLDKDELIGTVSIENINRNHRTGKLGIFIGNKEYWNNAYGTEAIRLILDYGFNYLNLHRVELDVMSFNERAIKCYKKCGFKEVGRKREATYVNGKYHDVICMDILENEFTEVFIRNKNI